MITASVTSIGNGAFSSCSGLFSVYFKGDSPALGYDVFYRSNNATVYYIPGTFGWGATFGGRPTVQCQWSLADDFIIIDNGDSTCVVNNYIGSGGDLTIPETLDSLTVITLADNSFRYLDALTSISIPGSVTTIGDWAFYSCDGLTNITIPDSVTTIGGGAFYSCDGLISVTIGSSVTAIGEIAFYFCDGLEGISVDPANTTYSSINGVLFNKSQTMIIQYPGGKTGAYSIPDSVTTIGTRAFQSCNGLISITIPDSVITIGDYAFAYCDGLIIVTIPDSVTTIGVMAFQSCDGLTGVYFKGDAPAVGYLIFSYSDNAMVYYIPGTSGWGETYGGRPTAEWPPSPADVDLDYEVDMYDFAVLAGNWGRDDCDGSNDFCNWADFDEDGYVNEFDLAILAQQWLFPIGSF